MNQELSDSMNNAGREEGRMKEEEGGRERGREERAKTGTAKVPFVVVSPRTTAANV